MTGGAPAVQVNDLSDFGETSELVSLLVPRKAQLLSSSTFRATTPKARRPARKPGSPAAAWRLPPAFHHQRSLSRQPRAPQPGNAPDDVVPERTYAVFEFVAGNLHGYLAAVAKFGQVRKAAGGGMAWPPAFMQHSASVHSSRVAQRSRRRLRLSFRTHAAPPRRAAKVYVALAGTTGAWDEQVSRDLKGAAESFRLYN